MKLWHVGMIIVLFIAWLVWSLKRQKQFHGGVYDVVPCCNSGYGSYTRMLRYTVRYNYVSEVYIL